MVARAQQCSPPQIPNGEKHPIAQRVRIHQLSSWNSAGSHGGGPGGGDGIAVGATLRAGVPHNNEGGTSGDRARAKSPTTVAEPTNVNLLQDAGMAMECIGAVVSLTLAPLFVLEKVAGSPSTTSS